MHPEDEIENHTHKSMLTYFKWEHLPEHLQVISKPFGELAVQMCLSSGARLNPSELTVGLRKLLEAKDCAVRAAV